MEPARPALLLTRPEAQSRRFAALFRARFGADWPVVLSPLTEIAFLPGDLPAELPPDIVFTSENAVAAFSRLSRDRHATAWCVGTRTEAAARAAGFTTRRGPGDWTGLARLLIEAGGVRRVFHPRGVHAAGDLPGTLGSAGIETVSIPIYDQRELLPTAEALRLMQASRPILLPLFSPRSARLAARAFAAAKAPLRIAAISGAADAAALGLPATVRIIAARPDGDAMLDALAALIDAGKTG
ncbi:uroporphyrinogen-III synthase [Albidovulum sp.]|uniref:uroporphyrinogen-III synthase n=1 Tax=Albidovulum sp. TaxID=1872424 RepID=UPI0039B89D25